MAKVLIVIDMQNDFIDGSLANPEAQKIVKPICDLLREGSFDYIYYTLDTHHFDYLTTPEGHKLPVPHCVFGTEGHKLNPEIAAALPENQVEGLPRVDYLLKHTFGTIEWQNYSSILYYADITLVGTCTDICVVSNALILKTLFPQATVRVLKDLCAGTTWENHQAALTVMKQCQVEVE